MFNVYKYKVGELLPGSVVSGMEHSSHINGINEEQVISILKSLAIDESLLIHKLKEPTDDEYDIYDDYESGNIPYIDDEQHISDDDISQVDISDDLKANFRSWERDCDNEDDANNLTNILSQRHPEVPFEIVKEMAYNWVGYDPNEQDNEN